MPSALLHAVLHTWSVSMPLALHLLAATAGGALLAATVCATLAISAALAIRGVACLATLALALAVCCTVAACSTVTFFTLARHLFLVLCCCR